MAGLRGSGKLRASSLRSRAVVVGGRALAFAALCALACAARAAGEADALGEPGAAGESAPLEAPAAAHEPLVSQALAAFLRAPALRGARVGVVVDELASGK